MSSFMERKPKGSTWTGNDPCSCGSELARTGDEIRVNMRFNRIGERQAVFGCDRDVGVHVAPRVDDDGSARARAGDEVRRLRQAFVRKPFKHEVRSASGS